MADDQKPWEKYKKGQPWTKYKPAPATAEAFKLMSEKPPENARFPALGRYGYDVADQFSTSLPALGAVLGAMAGGAAGLPAGPLGIPASVGAAGLGAMGGDRARRSLYELMYKDVPPEKIPEAMRSMSGQSSLAMGSELGGQLASKAIGTVGSKLLKTPIKSAATIEAADAGQGVRLTPGEATDNKILKKVEGVLEHWPGGAGPMEEFRVAQRADVNNMMDRLLNDLSSQKLSPYETGKEVQRIVKEAHEASLTSQPAYAEVKRLLGRDPDEYITPTNLQKLIREQEEQFSKQAGVNVTNSAPRRKLAEASRLFSEEDKRVQEQLVGQILKTQRPEVIGGFFEKAGLDELRTLRTVMPPEVQQNVARNVLENFMYPARDLKTGELDPKDLVKSLKGSLKQLGEGRGRLIFGDQYDSIVDATKLLDRMGRSDSGMAGSMHTARVVGLLSGLPLGMGVLTGLMTGRPLAGMAASAGTGAAEYVGPKMLAYVLTNPQWSVKALNLLRAAAVGSARGVPFAVDQISDYRHPTSPAQYAPLPQLEAPQP
jgi:hypothetical protein